MRIRSNMARVVAAGAAGVIGVASLTVVAGAVVGHPARSQSRPAADARTELAASAEATTTALTTTTPTTMSPTTMPGASTTTEGTTIVPTTSTSEAHDGDVESSGKEAADDESKDGTDEAAEGTDDEATETDAKTGTDDGTEHATTVPEDPSRPMTYRVADAGTVTFTRVVNVLTITSVDPASGWTAGQPTGDPHEWHVPFTHGDKTVRLTIVVNDGKVTMRVEVLHVGSTPPTTHVEHPMTTTAAPQPRPEPTTTSTTKA